MHGYLDPPGNRFGRSGKQSQTLLWQAKAKAKSKPEEEEPPPVTEAADASSTCNDSKHQGP